MKTTTKAALCVWAFLVFLAVKPARAFYDPGTQRWLNRDPIGEPGFEKLRTPPNLNAAQKFMQSSQVKAAAAKVANPYAYVRNNTPNQLDALGLEPGLPPGWHGPGEPYDPRSNPFCKPAPPCLAEFLTLATLTAAGVVACAEAPWSRACGYSLGLVAIAADTLADCLRKAGIL